MRTAARTFAERELGVDFDVGGAVFTSADVEILSRNGREGGGFEQDAVNDVHEALACREGYRWTRESRDSGGYRSVA